VASAADRTRSVANSANIFQQNLKVGASNETVARPVPVARDGSLAQAELIEPSFHARHRPHDRRA